MKRRSRSLDIFSLSFLDVISCGFGAVVMLILISKTDIDSSQAGADEVSALLASLLSLQNSVTEIEQTLRDDLSALESLSEQKSSIRQASSALQQELNTLEKQAETMNESVEGLSLVEQRLKQASLSTRGHQSANVMMRSVASRSTATPSCLSLTRRAV